MADPVADAPKCDVQGCGAPATFRTDGTEVDIQGLGRKALPKLNVCAHHMNWPHSEDARVAVALNAAMYQARK